MNDTTKPLARRILKDGRILELWQMLFNLRITVTLPENDGLFHEDMWCYKQERKAAALADWLCWDGVDEPEQWNKHPPSGRWREDGTPESEINQRD